MITELFYLLEKYVNSHAIKIYNLSYRDYSIIGSSNFRRGTVRRKKNRT